MTEKQMELLCRQVKHLKAEVISLRQKEELRQGEEKSRLAFHTRADSITRDITERKQVEDELRESEDRYHQLFEASTDAILVRFGETIIDANPAALKLFRVNQPQDVVGKRYLDRTPTTSSRGGPISTGSATWSSPSGARGWRRSRPGKST